MIRLSIVEHLSFQKNIPSKSGQPFNLAKIAIFCVADNNLIIKEIAILWCDFCDHENHYSSHYHTVKCHINKIFTNLFFNAY